MIAAVIAAAGHSTRMGRPKLALPLGDNTVLEHVIAAFLACKADPVLVVIAPHVSDLGAIAERAGASVLRLPTQTPEMRATIEAGLLWLEDGFHPTDNDAWFLVPADHPTLRPDVINRLIRERETHRGCSIFVPTHDGRRGHPALIGWHHVAGLRALPVGLGLNKYLRQHSEETREVPVPWPDVLFDLDTPEDYERCRREW